MAMTSGDMWTFEDILDENPPEKDIKYSKLQRFVERAGVLPASLVQAANEIERRDGHFVAAFFQLPFPIQLDREWIKVRGTPSAGHVELSFRVCSLKFDDVGAAKLVESTNNSSGGSALITQGILIAQVWGTRAPHHGKYLTHVDRKHGKNPVIVPQGPSWIGNRPMTIDAYEADFSRRLILEVQETLFRFLPAYAVTGLASLHVPAEVFGFCTMLAPGHVNFAGRFVPCYAGFVEQMHLQNAVGSISTEKVLSALKHERREIGSFERQVLALERLRQSGETALTLIGTHSLLEWLLKSHLAERGEKVPKNMFDLLNSDLSDIMNATEKEFAHEIRKARNTITHEQFPERHSITAGGKSGREVGGVHSAIAQDQVRSFLIFVFEVFRRRNTMKTTASAL